MSNHTSKTRIITLKDSHILNLPALALTIGNFDGVHLAHQTIIKSVQNQAQKHGYCSAVMIFEPQPREFFDPKNAPARLDSQDEKCAKLTHLGVDFVIIAHFDWAFAQLTSAEFIALLRRLNVRSLVLGDDFRFGKGRAGDKDTLMQAGFLVEHFASIVQDAHRISSTQIRQYLAAGKLSAAEALLGGMYSITGKVVHGNKIGRTLGIPTANIALNRLKPAVCGVFGVWVYCDDWSGTTGGVRTQDKLFGCANIGVRPSVSDDRQYHLEVHLPTFCGDLYGRTLTVYFAVFLHGEKKYDNLSALQKGIQDDIAALLAWHQAQVIP